MLTRNARKVLKLTKRSTEQKISYEELKKTLGWDYDKLHSACDQLIQLDLAKEKQGLQIPGRLSMPAWGIVLSEKGRNRWKFIAEDTMGFIIKSIFVPIIVSILTTLITLLITYLLSKPS